MSMSDILNLDAYLSSIHRIRVGLKQIKGDWRRETGDRYFMIALWILKDQKIRLFEIL